MRRLTAEDYAVAAETAAKALAAFKMKRHAVDQAKCRAMSRLREIVEALESVDNER